jgi:predicted nucleic acid-binding protein
MYFVDAWFFIARIDMLDRHHRQAERLADRISDDLALVTHEAVLGEVLTYFSSQGPRLRARAATAVRSALRGMVVVKSGGAVFSDALDLYERRPDNAYSLVDCMSMVVMKDRGMTHVLTNDHHFAQEGFTVLSGAP